MEISKIERVLTIYMVKPEIVCAILGTSENMGYVQFWRCNVSSFLVSSLADLDLPCSGSLSNNVKCIVTCFCSRYSTRWFVSPVSTHTLALRYLPGPSCSKLG